MTEQLAALFEDTNTASSSRKVRRAG
jgi:hypothetical protein